MGKVLDILATVGCNPLTYNGTSTYEEIYIQDFPIDRYDEIRSDLRNVKAIDEATRQELPVRYIESCSYSNAGIVVKIPISSIGANFRILFEGSYDGGSQFGQGCTACHKRQPDDGLADSQTAGNACGTVYKEVTADDKPCQSTYHIQGRLPHGKLLDFFFGCFSFFLSLKGDCKGISQKDDKEAEQQQAIRSAENIFCTMIQ